MKSLGLLGTSLFLILFFGCQQNKPPMDEAFFERMKTKKIESSSVKWKKGKDNDYWKSINNPTETNITFAHLQTYIDNESVRSGIRMMTNDKQGGLFKTIDKGSTWKKVQIPSVIKAANNVFIDRNNKHIYISTDRRTATYEKGRVWRSKDNGISWEQIFKAPFVWQAETSPVNPKLIVISAAGQAVKIAQQFMSPSVYLSQNGASTWQKINKNLGQPDPYNKNVLWCSS